MKKDYILTIILPTHYFTALHMKSIFSAISVAELYKEEVQLIIADNSKNLEKLDLLKALIKGKENIILNNTLDIDYIDTSNYHNNVSATISKVEGKFVLLMGDDDVIIDKGIGDILDNIKKDHRTYDVYLPPVGVDSPKGLKLFHYPKTLESQLLVEKLQGVLLIDQTNYIFYSIVKVDLFKEAFQFWISLPNLQSFHDHIYTLYFIIKGKFKILNVCHYLYNTSNWFNKEVASNTTVRCLKEHPSLPISLIIAQRLILANEGVFLIKKLVNDQQDAENAIKVWFAIYLNNWRSQLSYDLKHLEREIVSCPYSDILTMFINPYIAIDSINLPHLLDNTSSLYDLLNGTGSDYKQFWNFN